MAATTVDGGAAEPAVDDDPATGAGATPSRLGVRDPTLATGVAAVLVLTGFIVGARPIADNSFLTHLATGRLIIESGSVPVADPYSALAAGEPWTVQSWLVSALYAVLDGTLGGWSIRVVHGLAGAAVVAGTWRLVAPARQLVTRAALTGLVLLVGTFLWSPRPLMLGLVAMVLCLQVVQGIRPRWWLVPLFWVWVNAHGSFVLGLAVVGAVVVGSAIDQRRLPRDELRTAATAVVGCAVAALNPVGWRLLWFPFQLMGRSETLDRVAEWASPSFRAPVEQLWLLLLPLVVLAARRGAGWRSLLPAIVFVVAGLLAVRNLGLASIVIVGLAGPALAGVVGTLDGSIRGLVPRALVAVAAVGAVLATATVATASPIDLDDYPIDEIDWLEERGLVADPDVLVAQRDFVGNLLTLRYGTEARVFMDDRFDFHPRAVIADHNTLLAAGDFDEIVARNGFDVLLWERGGALERWVEDRSAWVIVTGSDDWFVACRTTSPVADRCLVPAPTSSD
ncbi:MAG: hypothetical protein ACFCVK_24120 [Acidimicrobiales bacterium]